MKLLDTNLLVYARDKTSPCHAWAINQIASLVIVGGEGAGLNAVSLAELCAEDGGKPADVPTKIQSFGVQLLDLPSGAATRCGQAYCAYRQHRKKPRD